MARRRCRLRRRRPCSECGARSVLVRYENVVRFERSSLAVHEPVQVRCTNKTCVKYWR